MGQPEIPQQHKGYPSCLASVLNPSADLAGRSYKRIPARLNLIKIPEFQLGQKRGGSGTIGLYEWQEVCLQNLLKGV